MREFDNALEMTLNPETSAAVVQNEPTAIEPSEPSTSKENLNNTTTDSVPQSTDSNEPTNKAMSERNRRYAARMLSSQVNAPVATERPNRKHKSSTKLVLKDLEIKIPRIDVGKKRRSSVDYRPGV